MMKCHIIIHNQQNQQSNTLNNSQIQKKMIDLYRFGNKIINKQGKEEDRNLSSMANQIKSLFSLQKN